MPTRPAQPNARKYHPSIPPKAGRPARFGDDDPRIPLADPYEDPAPGRTRWRLDEAAADLGRLPEDDATGGAPGCEPPSKYKLVYDYVLVYTPLTHRLDDSRAFWLIHRQLVDLLHRQLVDLLRRKRLSPRVVIDLSCVTSVSALFPEVLGAHSKELAKVKGVIRLAHVVPAVQAVLEKDRRPFRIYLRVDDAVLERW
jgi:hypothetical protein